MSREIILLPASDFSLEDITDAYNRTRTDYIIPMPMSPGRLQEYIELYDISLPLSRVAVIDQSIVGLGMLGIREAQAWITRLGVLPDGRRQGIGSAILQALLEGAIANEMPIVWLEVIRGNKPAHELFLKYGFQPTRELIVARRPPNAARSTRAAMSARKISYLQHDEVIKFHSLRSGRINWLNSIATMRNVHRPAAIKAQNESHRGSVFILPHLSNPG
jgi:ribosomal protein S18 acetylase RimI-like enzyme